MHELLRADGAMETEARVVVASVWEGGLGSCLTDIKSQFGKMKRVLETGCTTVSTYLTTECTLKMVTILKVMCTYHEKKKKSISLSDLLWKSRHKMSKVYCSLDIGSFVTSFSIIAAFQRSVLPSDK